MTKVENWNDGLSPSDLILSSSLLHLDHGKEAVSVLLVAVASVQPGQQQIKGVAKLVAVASPDL